MGFAIFMLWVFGILEGLSALVCLVALKLRFLWYTMATFVFIFAAIKLAEAYQ